MTFDKLKVILDNCLKQSAVAAAFAGLAAVIVTGGGGIPAAEEAFRDTLVACVGSSIAGVDVRFEIRSHWTPWGSCTR